MEGGTCTDAVVFLGTSHMQQSRLPARGVNTRVVYERVRKGSDLVN